MEFIRALKEVGEAKNSYGLRMFNHLFFGDVKLSIQASEFHYCEPRETLDIEHIDKYKSFEIGLLGRKDEALVKILEPYAEDCYDDLEELEDTILVFREVPRKVVEDVFLYLTKLNEVENLINSLIERIETSK